MSRTDDCATCHEKLTGPITAWVVDDDQTHHPVCESCASAWRENDPGYDEAYERAAARYDGEGKDWR